MKRRHQFTEEELETLRQEYGKLESIPVTKLPKLRKIAENATDGAVVQLVEAKIKFVSGVALNEAIRRGVYDRQTSLEVDT